MNTSEVTENQNLVIGITTIVQLLAIISYALRLYARRISGSRLWYDDYLMGVGLFFASIPCICSYVGLQFGLGKHVLHITPIDQENYVIDLFVLQLAWSFTFPTVKLAILFFYRRIFPTRTFSWVIYGIGTFVLLSFISNTAAIIFQCTPVQSFWHHEIPHHCINQNAFYIASGCINLASDIFILVMPIPILWKLKMSRHRKAGLLIAFLLGGFACIVSFCRILFLRLIDSTDITWSNVGPGLWSTAEGQILVVSGNLPSMRPILGRIVGKFRTLRETHNSSARADSGDDTLVLNKHRTDLYHMAQEQGRPKKGSSDPTIELPMNRITVKTDLEQSVLAPQGQNPTPEGSWQQTAIYCGS